MMKRSLHIPVLVNESLEYLHVQPDHWYLDATFGGGGHTRPILAQQGKVLAIDQDPNAIQQGRMEFKDQIQAGRLGRLQLVRGRFSQLEQILGARTGMRLSGALFDLGLSSDQLADTERGFSFQNAGDLDMRMDPELPVTASDLIHALSQSELAQLFRKFGEVSAAEKIATAIVNRRKLRPFQNSQELAHLIERVYRKPGWQKKIHPATQVFQSLRMAVNQELAELKSGLLTMEKVLYPEARLVVLAYHSLEDRLVKEFLRRPAWRVLTKHVVRPSAEEIEFNPRARSAKLRAAEKV